MLPCTQYFLSLRTSSGIKELLQGTAALQSLVVLLANKESRKQGGGLGQALISQENLVLFFCSLYVFT